MKRRDLIAGLPALGGLAAAFGAPAGLANTVIDEAAAKLTREAFGDLRIYFEGPTQQLKSMTAGSLRLKPGMSPHPPHEHPEEEFMVITEGSGEIVVEGKKHLVKAGSMMYCGANKSHGIVNTGKTPLMFYFYKWKA